MGGGKEKRRQRDHKKKLCPDKIEESAGWKRGGSEGKAQKKGEPSSAKDVARRGMASRGGGYEGLPYSYLYI